MSRSWNGSALLDEFTSLLGDTSATFRVRCLGWLNDVIFDISTRHDWGFHLLRGQKALTEALEIQSLEVAAPGAPVVTRKAGGSLTQDTKYRFRVTFVQAGGVESLGGVQTAEASTILAELTFGLSDIPTSPEESVIARRIYVQKAGGAYYFAAEIPDNFTTTYEISENPSSIIEPPDYESIRKLKGAPYFEGQLSRTLVHRDIDQLRLINQGQFTVGDPEFFSPIAANSMVTYPLPRAGLTVAFNYYRFPFRIYDSVDSQPDLPVNLKSAIKAGVIAYGFEYRDRDGAEMKKANYENALVDAINRGGRVANIEYTVRDVYGNNNGNEVG